MKIISATTMQEIDDTAINIHNISGLDLMENAAKACVKEIIETYGKKGKAVIVAGKGNNGGDGSVIARMLLKKGWSVTLLLLAYPEQLIGDAALAIAKLPSNLVYCSNGEKKVSAEQRSLLESSDLIIDAMLGTGLNNTISGGIFLDAINLMNTSGRPILSVDIPSGVNGNTGKIMGRAVKADVTVTFSAVKLGHIIYPGAECAGRLVVADIGIPEQLIKDAKGCDYITADKICYLLRKRDRHAHKGSFGHCLIVAGSTGKSGAATLTANSAVRAGSGLVTLAVPASIHNIAEIKTTESITVSLNDAGSGFFAKNCLDEILRMISGKSAMAIGPGMGLNHGVANLVQAIITHIELPLVIDADGLNALSESIKLLSKKKTASMILTPHPGEMSRLLGISVKEIESDRIKAAQECAEKYDVYIILKGAHTIIAAPTGDVAINSSGNPGMASGGMGDVLTGIVVSLLGQGYPCWDACCLGVFIHGMAADMIAENQGEIGMTATDVQEMLPHAFNRLRLSNLD